MSLRSSLARFAQLAPLSIVAVAACASPDGADDGTGVANETESRDAALSVCPLAGTLEYDDRDTAAHGTIELARTVASYGGPGTWGPDWTCSYDAKGTFGAHTIGSARLNVGGGQGEYLVVYEKGTVHPLMQFQLDGAKHGSIAFFASSTPAGDGTWAPQVTRADWTWDERKVAPLVYGQFSGTVFVDARGKDVLSATIWDAEARKIYDAIPGAAKRVGAIVDEKSDGHLRCRTSSIGRPSCEFMLDVETGALMTAGYDTRDLTYVRTNQPYSEESAVTIDDAARTLTFSGQSAEVLRLVSPRSSCVAQPGKGPDTQCTIGFAH